MSHSRTRLLFAGALAVLLLGIAAIVAFASTSFTMRSITPNPFNPTAGQVAAIRYGLPVECNFKIVVLNSAGTEVRTVYSHNGGSADPAMLNNWDGKDNNGQIVPNGTYTVVISGTATNGTPIGSATGTVGVIGGSSSGGTTPPPTTSSGFKITGISPNPFDPSKGSATITYTVPTTSNYSIVVKNSAGSQVVSIVNYVGMPTGTYTRTWNGKDSSGNTVPNGTYTFVIAGTTSGGSTLTTATAPVSVSTSSTTPPPTTQAFAITGITPNPYDPSKGSATVTYTVPATADYNVAVKNSSGTVIRTLGTYTGKGAGTYTATWDGKNSSGTLVANATYTVAVSGTVSGSSTAITTATSNLSVSTSTVTPPPGPTNTSGELGQTIEGCGSANFGWMKYSASEKFGILFIAPKSGTITNLTIDWKENGGYGSGNKGTYTFELQSNGSGNYPSGTVIAKTTGIVPTANIPGGGDGPLTFPISACLTAGTIYHLVIYDTDPNYSTNWSSPNTLMSRVLPWDGTVGNRGECYDSGSWQPWTSSENIWNTTGGNAVNGSHVPIQITWSDGTYTGDPYYSAAVSGGAYWYGANRAGENIVWNKATTSICKIGICVGKVGSPAGSLIYHLEKVGSGDLATGTIATASQVNTIPNWVYVTLPSAVTLTQGTNYRLWFESPSSSSSSNCYFQYIPYSDHNPDSWLQQGWGGSQSYYVTSTGSSWSTPDYAFDLTFSMQ